MTVEEAVRAMRETSGLLWQGLDATEAIEAYRRRFGKLPVEVWTHKGDEVTGVGVVLTYARDIPAGHLWMPHEAKRVLDRDDRMDIGGRDGHS